MVRDTDIIEMELIYALNVIIRLVFWIRWKDKFDRIICTYDPRSLREIQRRGDQ